MTEPAFLHAYILHSRPYRESSRLIDFWVAEQGRVSAIMRGSRRQQAATLLFQPLLLVLAGHGELRTVKSLEAAGQLPLLNGPALLSGFYINELLVRLLPRDLALPELFLAYVESMGGLAEGLALEPLLRCFEQRLLEALGYGFAFDHDAEAGQPVAPGRHYVFLPERGFLPVATPRQDSLPGELLLLCAEQHYDLAEVRRASKLILRQALAYRLGPKPLKSRELFFSPKN